MTSKLIENEAKMEPEYPKLMKAEDIGIVVLFKAPNTGCVVNVGPSKYHKIGEYCGDWAMCTFTPYHGKVELSN